MQILLNVCLLILAVVAFDIGRRVERIRRGTPKSPARLCPCGWVGHAGPTRRCGACGKPTMPLTASDALDALERMTLVYNLDRSYNIRAVRLFLESVS